MSPTSQVETPRIGARVLLIDDRDRVLLIHARDPDDQNHHWWELPGGGLDDGESLEHAAAREVAEETGIEIDTVGPCIWIRESRFHYRGRDHHRIDHVFLARCPSDIAATVTTKHTDNEKLGLIERAWLYPTNSPTFSTRSSRGRYPNNRTTCRLRRSPSPSTNDQPNYSSQPARSRTRSSWRRNSSVRWWRRFHTTREPAQGDGAASLATTAIDEYA